MRFTSILLMAACAIALGACAARADDEPISAPRAATRQLFKPDAFETLVNPNCSHCVDESKRRAGELRDDDRVLAWIRGKYEGGAIPLRFFLVPYRVISDTYGVFVFDADAGFVRGFEPSLDFRFHGWRNGVMVIRHQDGTLFSTLSGIAFDGPRRGERLKPIATLETDWGFWNAAYPGSVAYHMFDKYQPRALPRSENADSAKTRLEADLRGLDGQTRVIGLSLDDAAKAWSLTALEAAGGVIEDDLDGQKIAVLWHAPTRTAAIYAREVEGDASGGTVSLVRDGASPRAPFRDRETGSIWGIEGRAIDGPLKGQTLRWLPGVQCRWYAWAAEYPDTKLDRGPPGKKASQETSQSLERGPATDETAAPPLQAVFVDVDGISAARAAQWRRQGYGAAAVLLDERHDSAAYKRASRMLAEAKLDLYYWIEVARQPEMAAAHPEWMASLGTHDDWRTRFPNVPAPNDGEVAKAFPWVPLGYRDAYEAHLARVSVLLKRAAGDYRGLLLNDLQGGPASCGCGNLQCRWAIDYRVPSTTTKLEGDDVAARFVADVQKLAPAKRVIPVWMTECEDRDLPAGRQAGGGSTGYCGGVACSRTTCPKVFTKQWSALVGAVDGPLGLIATQQELGREGRDYGEPAGWTTQPIDYLDTVLPANGGNAAGHGRLWLVVQGYGVPAEDLAASRQAAAQAGVGAVVVALTRIDQTYEPRILEVK